MKIFKAFVLSFVLGGCCVLIGTFLRYGEVPIFASVAAIISIIIIIVAEGRIVGKVVGLLSLFLIISIPGFAQSQQITIVQRTGQVTVISGYWSNDRSGRSVFVTKDGTMVYFPSQPQSQQYSSYSSYSPGCQYNQYNQYPQGGYGGGSGGGYNNYPVQSSPYYNPDNGYYNTGYNNPQNLSYRSFSGAERIASEVDSLRNGSKMSVSTGISILGALLGSR